MNDLISLVKGFAPGIATVLGGPLAGMAVSALAKQLGVEDKVETVMQAITSNPEAEVKIKQLEHEKFKAVLADRADERSNLTERLKSDMGSDSWLSKNIRPMSLVAIFAGYFLFALMSAFGYDANQSYVELLGQWGMLIMSFYFGGRTIEKIMDMKVGTK